MPKFRVTYEETAIYETIVEAHDREEAEGLVVGPRGAGYETFGVRTLLDVVERTRGCEIASEFETLEVKE